MSTAAPEPYDELAARVAAGRPPGEEVAGPAITPFVVATREAIRAELALYRHAQWEAREQLHRGVAVDQSDSNGDALLELFSVPAGATGYLMRAIVDLAGVTPAAPMTAATLWLAIIALSGPGQTTPPAAIPVGSLMALSPNTPAVDAQIPTELVRSEHKESAPALVGPATFYLIVDATTADRQVACRWQVLVERPEP